MLYQTFLFSCIAVTGFSNTAYECPSKFSGTKNVKTYGQTCYQFITDQEKDFPDAQSYCENNGGNLAIVVSEGINNFIADTLKKDPNVRSTPFWIGLQNFGGDDGYEWVNGSKLGQYHNFDNNNIYDGEDCVAMIPETTLWSEYLCQTGSLHNYPQDKRFICEYPAVAITTTALPPVTRDDCPVTVNDEKDLQVFGNKCYYFGLEDEKTFQSAEWFCEEYGGTLAIVKSKEVNAFLHHHLINTHNKASRYDRYWIGLKYYKINNGYYWVDGTPLTNSHFDDGKGNGICVIINAASGKWEKRACRHVIFAGVNKQGFICEFDADIPLESSTTTPMLQNTSTTVMTTSTTTATTSTTINTTTTQTTTEGSTTVKPTCPNIFCNLDCGLDGFTRNPETGCMECKCDF